MDEIYRNNADGDLESIDPTTGEVQVIEQERTVAVKIPQYDLKTSELIEAMIIQGENLSSSCRRLGLPERTASYWMRKNEDFKERIMAAREIKGFYFEDKMEKLADSPGETREELAKSDFQFKAYDKLAGYHNKKVFGTKRVEQEHSGGMTLVIDTGIRRNDDQSSGEAVVEQRDAREDGRIEQESGRDPMQGHGDRESSSP